MARTHGDPDDGARTSRRSPGRPPIPIDRIVVTALQIIDDEGAQSLSMRALAERLGSGTATLYRHFPKRAALIAHVIDHIFGEVELHSAGRGTSTWQQSCSTLAQNMFDALRHHQNVAPLLVGQVPIGPNAMAIREFGIATLLDGGFSPHRAARSYTTLAHYVLGFAIQLSGNDVAEQPDEDHLAAVIHGVETGKYPATAKAAEALSVPLEDEFAFGLELMLNGLTHMHRD